MFEPFFGFTRTPFARDLPPELLFSSQDGLEALARLLWAVTQRGLALFTGELGSGKSTCLRLLRDRLDPLRHRWLYLANPLLPARGLFRQLLLELGVQPRFHKADIFQQLTATLRAQHQQDKLPVLVFDDAHLLGEPTLQELRLLTGFQVDSVSPLALLLVGQTALRDRLRLSTYDHLTQRLTVRYHLHGLTAPETREYIRHHLQVAGRTAPVFTPEAAGEIFQYARGLPRQINRVCTGSLLAASLEQKELVDQRLVLRVIADLNGG